MSLGPQILSCVWGSGDYALFLSQYITRAIQNDARVTSVSFFPSIAFFPGGDPNPGVPKVCTVVWRNILPGSTVTNPLYGPCHSSMGFERYPVDSQGGSAVTVQWSIPGEVNVSLPPPTHRGQIVLSAYWFNVDKTAETTVELNKYGEMAIPPNPTITINSTTMNGEPYPGNPVKQFFVTYGNWDRNGTWSFQTAIGMGGSNWNIYISPNTLDVNNRITLANEGCGASVYPIIVDQDSDVIFDGSADYQLADGQHKDLDLVAQAGCDERQAVWINWMFPTSVFVTMPRQPFVASSSPSAFPCRYGIRSSPSTGPVASKSSFQHAPSGWSTKDLRVNIYSATWGGQNYTEFVRQQYLSSTIYSPPTNTSNSWSFPVTRAAFGTDPNPLWKKCFVIIYRIARVVDTTDGVVFAASQMDPLSPTYKAEQMASVSTDQYPVLRDISDFRIAATQQTDDGFNNRTIDWLRIDLIAQSAGMSPWTPPTSKNPSIAKAVYSNKDVTAYAQTAWKPPPASTINVCPDTTGKSLSPSDPWKDVAKQMTVLTSYPVPSASNPGTIFQYQTYVGLNEAWSWDLPVPSTPSQPSFSSQWPQGFKPDLGPFVTTVQFVNNGNYAVWPCVCDSREATMWNGKWADSRKWRLSPNSSVSLDLVSDAGCTPDQMYMITFDCGGTENPRPYPPAPGWTRVGTNNSIGSRFTLKLTYVLSSAWSGPGQYSILRELAYASAT